MFVCKYLSQVFIALTSEIAKKFLKRFPDGSIDEYIPLEDIIARLYTCVPEEDRVCNHCHILEMLGMSESDAEKRLKTEVVDLEMAIIKSPGTDEDMTLALFLGRKRRELVELRKKEEVT